MNENRKGPVRYVKLWQAAGLKDHVGPSEFLKAPLITNHSSNHEEPDSTIAHNSIYRCLRGKAVQEICNFSFIGFVKQNIIKASLDEDSSC